MFSSSVFSLFILFAHFRSISSRTAFIANIHDAPRFLQIDAVDFARAGPACSREPTESQDFLHLLRGSDLAEDASLQDQWGFFWDSVGCVENIEMRLPRSKICQYDAR